jgi:hypothetical protein
VGENRIKFDEKEKTFLDEEGETVAWVGHTFKEGYDSFSISFDCEETTEEKLISCIAEAINGDNGEKDGCPYYHKGFRCEVVGIERGVDTEGNEDVTSPSLNHSSFNYALAGERTVCSCGREHVTLPPLNHSGFGSTALDINQPKKKPPCTCGDEWIEIELKNHLVKINKNQITSISMDDEDEHIAIWASNGRYNAVWKDIDPSYAAIKERFFPDKKGVGNE